MRSFFLSQRIFNFTKTTLQLLSFVLVLMTSVNAQSNCTLFVTDVLHPTSCQATNGGMIITATDQPGNPCERLIRVTSNGIQIASGSGNMTLSTLGTGTYEVFAMNGCGCTNVQTQIITLNGGTPTNLVPQTNKGLGFVQGNKFVVCRNSDISLGVQQLGIANLTIQGPNGFFSNKPDGSSFWNLRNLQPNQSGNYIITYTNASGCISNATIALTVGALNTNVGADRNGCFGTNYTIVANTTGQATCKTSCPITLDSLLVRYTLDQCNAMGQANQDDYSEFLPTYPSLGNCTSVTATNVYRDRGDHSCTPVLGSVASDIGLCTPAQESCDPLDYDPINAVKFQITINPSEAGRLSKLTFREQSPLVWITTNGSSGVNNYNTKYLLRVYKNDFLIYSEDNRSTERIWNLESLDFSNNPDFEVTETSTFRFELRGYCVTDANGNMSAWELDDIRIYGGCCTGITTFNTVNYLWSNGATTPSINVTPTSTTDYSVKVTDCNGCKANDAMKITVFPLPTPSIDGVAEICFGKSATLSALGGIIYNWSSGQTTNDIIVSPDITTTYTVTVTNANGCTATAQKILTVNPLPTPVVTGDLVICLNESTVLTASGGDSYLWNTAATTASITVGPTTTTSYSVTVTDSKTCSANTTVEVIVNPLPIALIVGDLEICIGDETSLTATGGQNYLWSDGSTTSTISVSPNVNTTYRVTVTDGNGCSQNTSVDVVVRPLPIPTITGELTICKGNNTTLTAGGGVSYEWSNGSTSTSITVAPFVSKTFTVTVTNQFGCLAQKEALVIINPLPNPSISGNESICFGSDVTLTASGAQIFSWSNGSNSQSITVSPVESTIYIVTVTDDNGCTASTARSVTVNPLPSVAISGQGEICNGDTVLLSANVVGNTFCAVDCKDELLLNWTLDQCNANTVADKTDFTELIPNYISSGGLSEVIATEIYRSRGDHSCTPDGNGGLGLCFPAMVSCDLSEVNLQNALRFKLNLKPNEKAKLNKLTFREKSPLMWVTADGATGINNNNRFYLLNVYRNGALIFSIDQVATEIEWNLETYDFSSNPYFTIDTDTEFEFELYGYCVNDRGGNPGWEVDDIQIFGGECSSSLAQNNASYLWSNGDTTKTISVNPSATSTYSVTITDCNGCQNSTNTTIIVNDLPIAAIIGDLEICNGASTTLTASGGGSYLWSTGETTASVTVIPSATTAYNVTITDDKGCTASISATVVVNDLPISAISGDLEICNGASTILIASGGTSYLWSTGATTISITVDPSATTAYSVTVSNGLGCTASTSATIVVNDLPIAAISGDLEICNGASTILTASGGSTYGWSTGATTSSITVNPTTNTIYTVVASNSEKCFSTTSVTVVVHALPSINVAGDLEICSGSSTTLTASGGTSYTWSNGETTVSITVSPIINTNYTITVTNDQGCADIETVSVVVEPSPLPIVVGDLNLCLGESTTLTASGGSNYLWSTGATTSVLTVTPTVSTIYSVTVSSGGCVASTSVTVNVANIPIALIEGMMEICIGNSTTLTASEGTSYLWSTGATTANIVVSPSITSSYTVTVTNANQCTATASALVKIKAKPIMNLAGVDKICNGDSTIIVVNALSEANCPGTCKVDAPEVLVHWDLNACKAIMNLGQQFDYSEFLPTVNRYNCTQVTASTVYRIVPNKHSCTPGLDGSLAMCIGSQKTCNPSKVDYEQSLRFEVNIQPNSSSQITGLSFYEQSPIVYNWIDGSTGPNNFATKFLLRVSKNGQVMYYQDAIPTNRDWGLVTFDFSDNDNFKTLTTANYLFELVPYCTVNNGATEAVWDVEDIKVLGGCCTATAKQITSYLWSDGSTSTSINVNPSSTTSYSVTATDCCGCTNEATYKVTVSNIIADLGPDLSINLGETVTLRPVVSGISECSSSDPTLNRVKYLWSTGETTATIVVTPGTSRFYRVTVTDCNECFDTESISINVRLGGQAIVLYPNPVLDKVQISTTEDLDPNMSIKVVAIDGKAIGNEGLQLRNLGNKEAELTLPPDISNGIYILEISNHNIITRQKIIVSKGR